MAFKDRSFEESAYGEKSKEENKFIIIACEGANTEHQYFNFIKDNLNLKITTKIETIPRDEENKNSSAPTKVVETLQNLTREKLQKIKEENDVEEGFDIFWIVVDREPQESKKVNLQKAIEICKKENYPEFDSLKKIRKF